MNRIALIFYFAVGILIAAYCKQPARPPPLGFTFKACVVEVYDGDTITVVPIPPRIKVRLLDCWAPEIRAATSAEKARALASRDYLRSLIDQQVVTVHVPASRRGRLDDVFTFGRVLARVYDSQGRDVSELQVKAGHATRTK